MGVDCKEACKGPGTGRSVSVGLDSSCRCNQGEQSSSWVRPRVERGSQAPPKCSCALPPARLGDSPRPCRRACCPGRRRRPAHGPAPSCSPGIAAVAAVATLAPPRMRESPGAQQTADSSAHLAASGISRDVAYPGARPATTSRETAAAALARLGNWAGLS